MAGNINETGVWRWMSKTDAGGWEQRAQLITTNSFLVIELERALSWIGSMQGFVQELLDDCASCWLGTAGDTTYYNQAGHTPGKNFSRIHISPCLAVTRPIYLSYTGGYSLWV